MAALLTALREGTLVVDGAMGTQLYERGILYSACFEELCVSRPELVRKIHEDYVRAGAQLIETNTFGTNALRLEKHGLQHRVAELNQAAVRLAREAAGSGGRVFVAGAIGPTGYFLGEALEADLRRVEAAFREQAEALVAAGVDALVVETMRQSAELRLAIQAVRAASGGKVPVIAHVSVDEAGRMADATSARDIGNDVVRPFNTDSNANGGRGNTRRPQLLLGKTIMGRIEGVTDQRFYSAQRRSTAHQLQRVEEPFRFVFTAYQIECYYATETLHLVFCEFMLRIVFKTRIVNARHFFVSAQRLRQTQSVFTCGAHTQIESLDSAGQQIGCSRIESRTNTQVNATDSFNVFSATHDGARSQIRVPA